VLKFSTTHILIGVGVSSQNAMMSWLAIIFGGNLSKGIYQGVLWATRVSKIRKLVNADRVITLGDANHEKFAGDLDLCA